MLEVHIEITGMASVHSSNSIKSALKRTLGIEDASVSHATGIAVVIYDPRKITPLDVAFDIRRQGYKIARICSPSKTTNNQIPRLQSHTKRPANVRS